MNNLTNVHLNEDSFCMCEYIYGYICGYKWKSLGHVWLFETPWTVAHQAPLSMEFSRQEILGWVAISFSRGSFQPRDWTQVSCVSCIGKWILYHLNHLGSPWSRKQKVIHFDLITFIIGFTLSFKFNSFIFKFYLYTHIISYTFL